MRTDTDNRRAVEVFYDGACPVCRREIAAYRRAGAGDAIAWVDVADDAAPAPAEIERAVLLARFHVRRADGELASGATAFFAVWRTMPRLRRVAALLDRPPSSGSPSKFTAPSWRCARSGGEELCTRPGTSWGGRAGCARPVRPPR